METVDDGRFTQVLRPRRGRPVRVDYAIAEAVPLRLAVWRQPPARAPA